MRLTSRRLWITSLVVIGIGLFAQPGQAAFSYNLTLTNEGNVPAPGIYATVDGVALDNDTLQFTVTPNDAFWGAGNTVVVFQFGFNNCDPTATGTLTFNLPAGWASDGSGNMDGFGDFDARVGNSGSGTDQDPLIFTVDTENAFASLAELEAVFQCPSDDPNGGSFFAAHMRGFSFNGTTSAFFADDGGGGGGVIPAPPALILLATAVPVFALRRFVRRKSTLA